MRLKFRIRKDYFRSMFAITTVLGILFVVSGIGKLLGFEAFVETIKSITHFPYAIAFFAGLCIMGFEIGGGVAFIFRYRIKLFVLLYSLLIGVFIIVLTVALIEQKTLVCHCFGIFDIGLSNYQELLLDVFLLDVLIFYGIYISSKYPILFQGKLLFAGIIILLLYTEYSIIQPLSKKRYIESNTNITETASFVGSQIPEFLSNHERMQLIFLLNYADFSCPPCFDSFMSLAESLQDRMLPGDRYRAVAIMKEDEMMNRASPARFIHWKEANNLTLPMIIAPDSIFIKMHSGKSAVLVLNSKSQIVFSQSFPLSYEQVKVVQKLME
jgi:hypothetical protein